MLERGQVTACLGYVAENFCIGQKAKKNQPWVQRQHNPHPALSESRFEGGSISLHIVIQAFHPAHWPVVYLRVGESIWCLSLTNLDDVDRLATSTCLGSRLLWWAHAQTHGVGIFSLRSHSQLCIGVSSASGIVSSHLSKICTITNPLHVLGQRDDKKTCEPVRKLLLYHYIS